MPEDRSRPSNTSKIGDFNMGRPKNHWVDKFDSANVRFHCEPDAFEDVRSRFLLDSLGADPGRRGRTGWQPTVGQGDLIGHRLAEHIFDLNVSPGGVAFGL
jgi:hypothetical protein